MKKLYGSILRRIAVKIIFYSNKSIARGLYKSVPLLCFLCETGGLKSKIFLKYSLAFLYFLVVTCMIKNIQEIQKCTQKTNLKLGWSFESLTQIILNILKSMTGVSYQQEFLRFRFQELQTNVF